MTSKIKNIVFGLKRWELILLVILLNFLNNYIFSVISNLFDISLNKGFNDSYTVKEKIVLFVLVAPLIETLLFQYVVIEIFKSLKMKLKYCCVLSAFVFASFHLYNIFYFLYAFTGGLLFAFLYIRGKNQKGAILLPLVAHIIYNGFVFFIKTYVT
ncbi:CPBP family intramembrane glutamic endopeptidase [Flavobacterium sp. S87F.05.LMB.W.Kidney.N]|uniref:CPBP family intramembrane glutamic endopeptidase n=1 Tax=Flavobacterium sp. S87F.05.LMB.W.Kidney.N TaxID=1278758 RepID=UPI001064BF7A|nr:CPBP family intramembrane glutamic endopeptidase [Flavobacterium sp. S87F.05.LMB.W.Kidney.N]TDX14330.1 CAAX prenyl protease-like protein [Flavobacterium sp. S87F.05.LMB.W.Kidney.N]